MLALRFSLIAKPKHGIDAIGHAAHDSTAQYSAPGIASEVSLHQRSKVKTHKPEKPLGPSPFRISDLWKGNEKNESNQQVTFYESGP